MDMGGCVSDVRGGQQAIGGIRNGSHLQHNSPGTSHNEAVDFFCRTKGLDALFTQIEVRYKDNTPFI